MIAQPKVISSSLCGILGRWIMGGIEEILLIAGGRREKERREREGGRERKREREIVTVCNCFDIYKIPFV